MMVPVTMKNIALLFAYLMACGVSLASDNTPKPDPTNKLTAAYYNFSSGKSGVDINLRHSFKSMTGWIGGYRESRGFNQARLGYEYDYHHNWITFVPSAQAATRGFVGATVYAEAGRRVFAIGGAGRTNLQQSRFRSE
jgi:hypothetical protein